MSRSSFVCVSAQCFARPCDACDTCSCFAGAFHLTAREGHYVSWEGQTKGHLGLCLDAGLTNESITKMCHYVTKLPHVFYTIYNYRYSSDKPEKLEAKEQHCGFLVSLKGRSKKLLGWSSKGYSTADPAIYGLVSPPEVVVVNQVLWQPMFSLPAELRHLKLDAPLL